MQPHPCPNPENGQHCEKRAKGLALVYMCFSQRSSVPVLDRQLALPQHAHPIPPGQSTFGPGMAAPANTKVSLPSAGQPNAAVAMPPGFPPTQGRVRRRPRSRLAPAGARPRAARQGGARSGRSPHVGCDMAVVPTNACVSPPPEPRRAACALLWCELYTSSRP